MLKNKFNHKSISDIGDYYGGLYVMENEGKYYWLIKNNDTDFNDLSSWFEIIKPIYDSLIAYENQKSSKSES